MYPNPQDALPLPTRPNLEQYKKLAKELRKCATAESLTAYANGQQTGSTISSASAG